MESEPQHPFRNAELRIYKRIDAEEEYIARFWPYQNYPILFSGKTPEEVTEKGEAFRAEMVAKHEANFIARAKQLAAAQKANAERRPRKTTLKQPRKKKES